MSTAPSKPRRTPDEPEPTWEIAYLFPAQGQWTEEEYLALETNHLVELTDGVVEVLPMPTTSHQLLVVFLLGLLQTFTDRHKCGLVLPAPLRVRLWGRTFREPDIVFMRHEHADRIGENYWDGADLVMEVVSGTQKDRERDLRTKRREYARAGFPEYWMVDPKEEKITVLRLAGKRYLVHGEFGPQSIATSHLLPGFTVNVAEAFSRARVEGARETKGRKSNPRRRK